MDTPYARPFMRGWVKTAEAEPVRDGSYVMFARDEERTKDSIAMGGCPFVFGHWYENQGTPGWADSYGMRIVLEHWPRWTVLSEIAWSPV